MIQHTLNWVFSVFFLVFIILLAGHPASEAKTFNVDCDNRTFAENFENVSPPVTAEVDIEGPIRKCSKDPVSSKGWTKGDGCSFSLSIQEGNLSGVHRGVFDGVLDCEGKGHGGSGNTVTWKGTVQICPGNISELNTEEKVHECDNRLKAEDVGPPGSEQPIDGCSIPQFLVDKLGWESRNVMIKDDDPNDGNDTTIRVGGGGPDSGLPCDNHDVCYRNCQSEKSTCDANLGSEIEQLCFSIGIEQGSNIRSCRFQANQIERFMDVKVPAMTDPPEAYAANQMRRCKCCGSK